jgi:hypothetical protein
MQMFLATLLATAAVAAPSTDPATNVTATGATLNGSVDGAATVFFQWGTSASYGNSTANQAVTGAGPVSASLSTLSANTTYHYRLVVNGTPANDQTFTTSPNPLPPVISNQRARDIGPDSVNATATIDPKGSTTSYRVEYGTTTRYGSQTAAAQTPTTGISAVSVKLANLRPYTRYHWRTVATNAAGTANGADRSFRTGRLPTAVSLARSRKTVPWGGDVRLGGRVSGAGVGGMTVELQRQRPQDAGFVEADTARTGNDGGYLFTIPKLWETTRYRVVTRTQTVATSPTVTVKSRVRAGIRSRLIARKRARLQGSVMPGITGTVVLQLRRPGLGWEAVRTATLTPATETVSRYAFVVRRLKRVARRFRIVAQPEPGGYARGWSRSVVVKAQPKKKKKRRD